MVPNCMFQSSRIVKVEDVVKCTVAYHKIDFYIPNQLLRLGWIKSRMDQI